MLGAVFCLGASAVLVSRIERLAGRLGMSEAMLGLGVALAADSPEVASAVTAVVHGQKSIGVGVVLGSNAFNLAALLGLAGIVAGRIALHRRVVLLEGALAIWVAAVSVLAISGGVGPRAGLALVLVAVVPYVVLSGASPDTLRRLRVPARSVAWLHAAIEEEESELAVAIHPIPPGRWDPLVALTSLVVVIVGAAAMEQGAAELGKRYNVPDLLIGSIVLAAATSLPNAVGAIYLATRGRGAAVLSTTMNSNTLNVLAGLFVPASIAGLAAPSGDDVLLAAWYAGLTVISLALAYRSRGFGRRAGALIVATYVAFVVVAVAR